MNRYVNHQAIAEAFELADAETNPTVRAELLDKIQTEFVERLLHLYERTAFELKAQQHNTGQIADTLGFSDRRIRRMIHDYSSRTGAWNPLARRSGVGAIDISHLVQRRDTAIVTEKD